MSYEQEEAGILQATKNLSLNLSVEESGALRPNETQTKRPVNAAANSAAAP